MLIALALCRWAHYAAALTLFGAVGFTVMMPAGFAATLNGLMRPLVAVAASVALITAMIWLGLEAGSLGDGWPSAIDPATIESVIVDTAFGRVCRIYLLLLVILAALARGYPRRARLVAALSGLGLVILAQVGHAAMHTGPAGWLTAASFAVHLLAGGAWIGSLVPLLLVMRRLDDPRWRLDATLALRRFSNGGHGAVAAVVLSGVVNAALVLGHWPTNLSSPYEAILAAKVTLVVAMVAVALFNRYGVVPRLQGRNSAAMAALRRNTGVELALGAAVLALVSLLGLLEPD